MKFEEKKVYYFFGRKYYFFQWQFSHLTSINLLDLQSKTIVFCAKYLTNFSPIQYVYDEKSPYSVEKSDIYQIKKNLCSCQDIHESLELSPQLLTLTVLIQVRSAKIKYGLIFVPKPIRLHNKTNSEICFIWQILDQSPKLTTVTTPLTLFRTKLFAFKDTFFNSRNVRGIDHHFGCYCLIVHHSEVNEINFVQKH